MFSSGRGSGTSGPNIRTDEEDQRERKAEQEPHMRRADGAEAARSVRAASRCARSGQNAAMTVKTAQSQGMNSHRQSTPLFSATTM